MTMGDEFMALFCSAVKALECAIAVQRAFAQHSASGEGSIRVRVGLNGREPVVEEQDLFGTAVRLARRICGRAEPGQILVSGMVRKLAPSLAGLVFAQGH